MSSPTAGVMSQAAGTHAGQARAGAAGSANASGSAGRLAGGNGSAGAAGASNAGAGASATMPDKDSDGIPDMRDNCVDKPNMDQADQDGDKIGDACDNCPKQKNEDQRDANSDGTGDACACANPVVTCTNGMAGPFPCSGVDMMARVTLSDMGARSGNAIWGGVESKNHREIAVVGLDNGTAFIDLTSPACPVQLGRLPSTTGRSVSRDVKVLGDYALVVAEIQDHGMLVFDMRTLGTGPSTAMLTASTVYKGTSSAAISNAHNIVVHEATKMVYLVGSPSCKGGLHMVDFKDPMQPKFLGCGTNTDYVHDAMCLVYSGPDKTYTGHELCITFNGEKGWSIIDLNDKANPKLISHTTYMGSGYTHQGWLTENQTYMAMDDELDEQRNGHATRTYLYDMTDLDKPVAIGTYDAKTKATDHNLYILGQYAYQANYTAGMRILDVHDIAMGKLREVAFFDTLPSADTADMRGAWTAFPYFKSGIVIMQTTESGMFILAPQRSVVGDVPPP